MFSFDKGLSRLIDKDFLVGFMLPAAFGMISIVILLNDISPRFSLYSYIINTQSSSTPLMLKLSSASIGILWIFAVILQIMNGSLQNMLVGYSGPFNRTKWKAQMAAKYEEQSAQLCELYRAISDPETDVSEELRRQYYSGNIRFRKVWPSNRRLVLPTRFGNVIRAAETYALQRYGADSVALWPRMQALVSKKAQAQLNDARAQLDCFINLWVLGILCAVIAITRSLGALYSSWPVSADTIVTGGGYALASLGAILFSWLAYEKAIERGFIWGELFRSAFDLYLPSLAKQMGYKLPPKEKEQRRFWAAVNNSFLYQQPMRAEDWTTVQTASGADTSGDTKKRDKTATTRRKSSSSRQSRSAERKPTDDAT
jgi:hypothetical protein